MNYHSYFQKIIDFNKKIKTFFRLYREFQPSYGLSQNCKCQKISIKF